MTTTRTKNTITVQRETNGRTFEARARYDDKVDGWTVTVLEREPRPAGGRWWTTLEQRGPVNDAWAELVDMLELAQNSEPATK